MPNFSFEAIDNMGKLNKGTMIALNESDVEKRLIQSGKTLIKCKLAQKSLFSSNTGGKIQPRILVEFYYRLAQALELGLPILAALDENAKSLPSPQLKKIASEMRVAIEGGNTFYESMLRFPKTFGKLDVGIVKMGEQAGALPKSMKDLSEFLSWKEEIRSTIKRASMYPSFIMLTIIGVIGVWVGYVLPMMAVMLKDMGIKLPQITINLLAVSAFLKSSWLLLLGGLILSIVSFIFIQKTKQGGLIIHKYLLKFPVIGNVANNIALARLCHNFATMYSSGMGIHVIFDILKDDVIGNRYIENRLNFAYQEIQRGQSVSGGFENSGGFSPLFLGAVRNGELTGTLDATLKRLGDYYDAEVKRSVQTMVNAFEPLTLLILGGVFGMIVLSIMLPLYDVMGSIGKAY
ncbi:MAG: type II secretion system F family protein [Desulfobacterales bacterium]|nr:type II secretion system F family protein [Desulfobacterales bacterium]